MKKILTFSTLFLCLLIFGQFEGSKQIFEAPNLKEKINEHKTVAIIPFDVKITYRKQPKNFNLEANRDQEKAMASNIQSSMYTFLLRKRDNYKVSFQDVEKTNIFLKKAGMFDKLDQFTRDEIAKVLGVDAVIGGKFEVEQTKTEAGALVTAIAFGGFGGKTGTGTLTMTINDVCLEIQCGDFLKLWMIM